MVAKKLEAQAIVDAAAPAPTEGPTAADSVAALVAAITPSGKAGGAARLAAMKEAEALFSDATEPFFVRDYLPALLSKLADKDGAVAKAARGHIDTLVKAVRPAGMPVLVQVLFGEMKEETKWQVKAVACGVFSTLATAAPEYLRMLLPSIVPALTGVIHDIKDQVSTAARQALRDCAAVDNNKDVRPNIPAVISAMENPEEVPECIHVLASTTFVQTVESSALALVVPLMLRGFREKQGAIKRQCCRIVANMSKLVEEPLHALSFIQDLIPAISRATEEISDPEARGVAEASLRHLEYLQTQALATERKGTPEQCATKLAELCTVGVSPAFEYIGACCSQMIRVGVVDAATWTETLQPLLAAVDAASAATATAFFAKYSEECQTLGRAAADEEEAGELLCDCKFTLAYGTKVLLHNTEMRLRRGARYGLVGANDCGKTTLLRSIANNSVDNFPHSDVVRTVLVEADIQGDLSHLACVDYVLADPGIQKLGITYEQVKEKLLSVNFTEKMCGDGIDTLSGGWRMKLALARAMLQNADILLMDEPTNHLDVMNVKWVIDYLISLTNVTSIIVSTHAQLLDSACTHILQFNSLKLRVNKGNLSDFRKIAPEVDSYFSLKASKLRFKFPPPSFLDGVKSRGKALMKVDQASLTYPGNTKPTISNATVRVSMSSRVACLGPNGAGKSTLIKVLTGEIEPTTGTVWTHPDVKVGYIAQHAFHHIENHLDKTPNEYIRWRYEHGEDKEGLAKETLKLTPEEEELQKQPIVIQPESGPARKQVIEKLMGGRKDGRKGEKDYEVKWVGMSHECNSYVKGSKLEDRGFAKFMRVIDQKIAARESAYARTLTQAAVEQHLSDVGLEPEFATHHRIRALSGGQKVKVVLAASMWDQPHIIILDEPTNYLDRESLGALSHAIEEYEGGVVMITHNNEFCADLCPETWVVEAGMVTAKGDADWMEKALKGQTVSTGGANAPPTEMIDANGNVSKVKGKKKARSRKELKKAIKARQMRIENGETVSSDSELDQLE